MLSDLILALVFLAIVAGGITDLILDAPERWWSPHIVVELALITLSLGLAVYLWRGWHRTRRALRETRTALTVRNSERDRWRENTRRVLEDFGREVSRQFGGWGLTPAERHVAMLLLKGLSHKEIAVQTSRSERTVRQHAVAVYRKAGLSGRAALAAFFLGDLRLPPASETDPTGGDGDAAV